MKLKHRKLILIISMGAMGIGLISFSIAGNKSNNDTVASFEVDESEVAQGLTPSPTAEPTSTPTMEATTIPTDEPTSTPTDTPTPTQAIEEFEVDAYPEVNELVVNFLQAKIDGKTKKLKKLVTDASYIDADTIQKKTEFIESYDNIKVYTAKVPENLDADFIAYVYMEVKIASIETKAPGLDQYLIKKVDDEYKIVYGDISEETADFVNEIRKSDEFDALLKKVDKKMKKALESDEQLADFVTKLETPSTTEE